MAPLLFISSEPQPGLEVRQDGASPAEVVLTVIRQSTTLTTTMTLASAAPTDTEATPTAVATQSTFVPAATSPDNNNNGVVIGAVLGSFLGILVLLTLVWKCCYDNRSVAWVGRRRSRYSDSDSSLGTESELGSNSDRVRRRGGGGDEEYDLQFDVSGSRRSRRSHGIKRPDRAWVKRERTTRYDSRSRSGRGRRNRETRRRSHRGVNQAGMFGWALPGGGPARKAYVRRDSWARETRSKYSDDI